MKDKRTIPAPTQYNALDVWWLRIICPNNERGMDRLSPTVVTKGEVSSIEYAQQKSETNDVAELINTMARTRFVGGSSNFSIPKKCIMGKPGSSVTRLNRPTNPKKRVISTLDSFPILFFIRLV